eukprot:m.232760 g.232760  ORF g.232760 m.232760 type:complete len:448 (+) comp15722_c0_seq1:35-1378(+)
MARCVICLDDSGSEPLLSPGCACRGDSGLAHLSCRIEAAAHGDSAGRSEVTSLWTTCGTCGQRWTGPLQHRLAATRWDRTADGDEETPAHLNAATAVAECAMERGDTHFADQLFRKVHSVRARVLGETHDDTLTAASNLALCCTERGEHAEAESLYQSILDVYARLAAEAAGGDHPAEEATRAPDPADVNTVKQNLAVCLQRKGDYDAAVVLEEETLASNLEHFGEESHATLNSMNNLGMTLTTMGRLDEAEAILRRVLPLIRRVMGASHPHALLTAGNLARCLADQNNMGEALELAKSTLIQQQEVLGTDHFNTVHSLELVGDIHAMRWQFREAEAVYRELVEAQRRAFGEDDPVVAATLAKLGMSLASQGSEEQLAEAEVLQRSAVDLFEQTLGSDHCETMEAKATLRKLVARRNGELEWAVVWLALAAAVVVVGVVAALRLRRR